MVSLRGDVADVGILMMSVNMISQQSQIRVAAVATLLAVYVMF